MKKVCSILLAAVLLFSALTGLPLSVSANGDPFAGYEQFWEGDFCFIVYNEGAVLRSGPNVEEVIIPNTLGGYPVIAIEDQAFWNCDNLKHIEIPDTVTSIGEAAFMRCENLESIDIPYGVTKIPMETFYYCENLKSVTIPDSVTLISLWSFFGCGLLNLDIPNSVTSIDSEAFVGCDFSSVFIPSSVEDMGELVFRNCTNLTDIYCEAAVQPEGWYDDWNEGCTAAVH